MILSKEGFNTFMEQHKQGMPVNLTIKDMMGLTGISKDCLAFWRMRGFGPKYIKHGKSVKYPFRAVLEWIEHGDDLNNTKEFPPVY